MPALTDPKDSKSRFDDFSSTPASLPESVQPQRVTPKFTNIESNLGEDEWIYISPEGEKWARDQQGLLRSEGQIGSGSMAGGVEFAGDYDDKNQQVDPRVMSSPQGTFTEERMRNLFPEMFAQVPELPEDYGRPDPADANALSKTPDAMYDRDRFEKHVFEQIGGNPFLMNPYNEVDKANADLPGLFNHVFQGRIAWNDLGRLNKDELAYWESAKKQYRAEAFERAKQDQKQKLEQYKWMMDGFDQKKALAKSQFDEQMRNLREAGKAPDRIQAENKDGYMTHHTWNPITGTYEDTGLVSKTPEGFEVFGKVPPHISKQIQIFNMTKPRNGSEMDRFMALMIVKTEKDEAKQKTMIETDPLLRSLIGSSAQYNSPQDKEMHERARDQILGWMRSLTEEAPATDKPGSGLQTMEIRPGQPGGESQTMEIRPGQPGGEFQTMPGKASTFRPAAPADGKTPPETPQSSQYKEYDPTTDKLMPYKK